MSTNSLFGLANGQNVGPALFYLGTTSGEIDTAKYQGHTESTTVSWEIEKVDIVHSQTGTAPVNKVQTGVPMSITCVFTQPTLERLNTWMDNIVLQYTSGEVSSVAMTQKIGQADSEIEAEATLVIQNTAGIDAEFQKVIFPKVAPKGSAELVYNAGDVRKYSVEFSVYPDETREVSGNPVLFYSASTTFDS